MSAPPTIEIPARLAPAAAVRRFYSATRDLYEPAALYPALVAVWAEALGDAPVVLLRPDPYRGGYRLRAAAGWPDAPVHELRLDPADLPPILRAPSFTPGDLIRLARPNAALAPFRPVLAVPLADAEGVLGLLLLGARHDAAGHRRPYSAAERTLLRLLADPTTVALRAAVVARRAARNAEQLQALHQLGEELSANLDLESVYTAVYDQLRRALAFDSFFIARFEDEIGMLAFPFGVDEGVRYTLDPVVLGTGLTSAIYQSGRPLVIDDLRQGVAHLNIPQQPDAFGSPRRSRSWMGTPMIAKHRVIGVLAVQAYTPNLYSHEQVQFLSSVANQVAGTLENALLLREREARIAERVAELSAL
ncbi:MAG: GAF domain-containing protein, partial [Chloroflexota bacterium]|nr:GAF domain-containing protein [Chloroflexota bacterium]